ncbi:NAD-dependent epimerase/dehydratase family protein [Actinomadura citrea]|uniref:UDP-glucose 4-epimerase n=1 Tax=Actinomadura citrea TaxID=46158 RepID=A0A7Y9KD87_9ACTN|nr:NAD(P)-dependent oxidoreductase [Actinomadura citrea]NYE14827.1 UDP-glucose 4-epimerase [Actinomadura citrea]GGT82576.1 NAD-dependent epimerase [Actinomadura citrea]
MILVTGGMGFIGSHTVRALLDLGESCVLVQRRTGELPADLAGGRSVAEQADITDLSALLDVGERHDITGIVHLAGSMPWPPDSEQPVEAARKALDGLFNVLQAAQDWGVDRVGVASTIGVYGGLAAEGPLGAGEGPLSEDMPLSMTSAHLIPTFKKIGELLNAHLADAAAIDVVNYRISGTWGPRDPHGALFFAAPELVHAAVRGTEPDLSTLAGPAHAEDSIDLCYVKDTARAIALLQLADRLDHRTYNVASGRATTNAEIIAAIKHVVPDARVELPTGGDARQNYLDITRLQDDTGYKPEYDTERAVTDYIAWLRAGNEH